jgi:hypothetical protein
MKGANALLAILILLMSVSPCGDVAEIDGCGNKVHYHFSTATEHEHVEDICTPFCSCACCSIPLSNSTIAITGFHDTNRSIVDSIIELQLPPPPFKIWQPPKI